MIPFQTILALLALLMVMGCSQEKPPHSKQPEAQIENPASRQNTPAQDPNIVIKPPKKPQSKPDPEQTVLSVEEGTGEEWTLKFSGKDAQRLYWLTQIEAVPSTDQKFYTKTAHQYRCDMDRNAVVTCEFKLKMGKGELVTYEDPKLIQSKPEFALFEPATALEGVFFNFNKSPEPYFRIEFKNDAHAQSLYTHLLGDGLSGEIEGPKGKLVLKRKKGEHINCTRDTALSEKDPKAYWCILYGNLSSGSFEVIHP